MSDRLSGFKGLQGSMRLQGETVSQGQWWLEATHGSHRGTGKGSETYQAVLRALFRGEQSGSWGPIPLRPSPSYSFS